MAESTRDLILHQIQTEGSVSARDIQEATGLSRQAVNYHIRHLREEGMIEKTGTTRAARYVLAGEGAPPGQRISRVLSNRNLEEHQVFADASTALNLNNTLNTAAFRIVQYSFSELLNNAIEHSGSQKIHIQLEVGPYDLHFRIVDNGVGIFEHIKRHNNLHSEAEALQDLLKGKTTTDPEHHTGEGIFFSSKACDRMRIISHRLAVGFDVRKDDVWTERTRHTNGTRVEASITRRTHRDLTEIFHRFGGDEFDYQFARTSVRVVLSSDDHFGLYSRSEARRLLAGLDRFRVIELDFSRVQTVGQAFTDEIFRVFQNNNPDITIEYQNANEAVQAMIGHVLTT